MVRSGVGVGFVSLPSFVSDFEFSYMKLLRRSLFFADWLSLGFFQ